MFVILLAAAVVGVDYGWQPRAGGGFEYIIQIEPEMLDSLSNGEDIVSDLPPYLRGVRSYRITVGSGEVPRLGTPPLATPERDTPATSSQADTNQPATPPTFEVVDDPAETPRLEFTPGPVVDRGQWQPRHDEDKSLPSTTLGTADVTSSPLEPETGPSEPSVPLKFPSPPSHDPPGERLPLSGPSLELPATDAMIDSPKGDVAVADEPPHLPLVTNRADISTEPTNFEEDITSNRTAAKVSIRDEASNQATDVASDAPPQKEKALWWPLALCLLGLCLSLGGNVYLGWLTVAFRNRYRNVARRLRGTTGGGSSEVDHATHLRWG